MSRPPPMLCKPHGVPECPTCKAGNAVQRALEPVAWRFKERINGEFDSDWILTKHEPADGVRIIAKEPLYAPDGVKTVSSPERSAQSVMMSAHALCPADMSHPKRMAWMADYFLKNYAPGVRVQEIPLTDEQRKLLTVTRDVSIPGTAGVDLPDGGQTNG